MFCTLLRCFCFLLVVLLGWIYLWVTLYLVSCDFVSCGLVLMILNLLFVFG